MQLLVGLGNPGAAYAGNRHNAGFLVLEALASAHGAAAFTSKFSGRLAELRLGGEKQLLLMPQTYMNRSGQSVGEAMRFYKLVPEDVTVFYDDLDLAPGRVKIKRGGGHGGHNGLRDIDAHIGPDYRRVRIGIGHPGHKDRVADYVLHDFSGEDRLFVEPAIETLVKELPNLLAGKDELVTQAIALRLQSIPVPEKRPKNA